MPDTSPISALEAFAAAAAAIVTLLFWGAVAYWTLRELCATPAQTARDDASA